MGHVSILPVPGSWHGNDDSDWCFVRDIESDLTSLAAMCQMKRQQTQPLAVVTEHGRDGWPDKEDDTSLTKFTTCLAIDGTKTTRMRFLDRPAEV